MEIFIFRHGRTVWNKEKRLQGSTDIALSDSGRQPAIESAKNMQPLHFDRIYTSPLKRAYETASILKADRDIPLIADDRLKELCFGAYEGKTNAELDAEPDCTFRYFFTQPERYVAAPDGESLEHLILRAAEFMTAEIEPLAATCERVMIVAHGAINKALMCHVKQHGIPEFWSGGLQKNCSVIQVDYTDGMYSVTDENRLFYEYKPKH